MMDPGVGIRFAHIHFVLKPTRSKIAAWSCRNNTSEAELGVVQWWAPWRQYCYFPTVQAIYSAGCLEDIGSFIVAANERKKKEAKDEAERPSVSV